MVGNLEPLTLHALPFGSFALFTADSSIFLFLHFSDLPRPELFFLDVVVACLHIILAHLIIALVPVDVSLATETPLEFHVLELLAPFLFIVAAIGVVHEVAIVLLLLLTFLFLIGACPLV